MDHQNVADLNRVARNDEDRKKIMCTADFMTRHPQYDTVPRPILRQAMPTSELALDLIEDACDGIIAWLEKQL